MEVAKRYREQLSRLQKNVRNSYRAFKPNYDRFNKFRRFVFDTSLDDSDRMVLTALNKPQLEFNILEAYISRLRGEFSKQEPSIKVMADDLAKVNGQTIDIAEGHLRHIIFDANKNGCEYQVYTDLLSGGFSAIKVFTEYAHEMSFNQVIKFDRVYDPTLTGFDPLARAPHKGDGRFCFELYPKTKEEFEEEYPDVPINEVSFTRALEGFNWSYNNDQEDILLICDYYEKKRKRVKIVQLVNGHTMTMENYEKFLELWQSKGLIEEPPAIMGKPRWTEVESICRFRFIENQVLEYVETNFKRLPLIFVDGNSIVLRDGKSSGIIQMTRPYIYHAEGIQKLKNYAGQSLANELENLVQHKFKVAKESLPDEQSYLDAYTNIQIANTLVYKAFKDNDPKVPVPPPMEIQRTPIPPEVSGSFSMADQVTQAILGSYDAALGINDNELSGVAIVEGATQSNATAMPYVVGFLQALTQVANIIIELIPKYYVTPRTIPILRPDGSRDYVKINQQGGMDINYDENALQVKVEAGVNFAVQKSRALSQLILLMQASPVFAQFMNAKGLKVILDNFEARGVDQLKERAEEWEQELAQQQQMQVQQQEEQMRNNPLMIKAQNERMKIELDAQQSQAENQIKAAEVSIEKQRADTEFIKVMAEVKQSEVDAAVQHEKAQAEETRAAVDLALKVVDTEHTHDLSKAELQHKMEESKRKFTNE